MGLAALLGLALVATPLATAPAIANTAGTGVVINEAYVNGGSSGATYLNKFVELYNPTNAAIDLAGTSLQYRSATGTVNPSNVVTLTGSIAAGGYYLVQGSSNATNGQTLPAADASTGASWAGGGGTFFLANQATALTAPPVGSLVGDPAVIDLLGFGSSNTFETARASAASVILSLNRTAGVDTDVNAADFTTAAPTPTNAVGTGPAPDPEPEPPVRTDPIAIATIQGTGFATPIAGTTVTTRGVVTASFPTGGYNGYYIQTPGTGVELDAASDGIFVYSSATVAQATVGTYVEVTGLVSEFYGLTQLEVAAGGLTIVDEVVAAPVAADVAVTSDVAQRESLEGMLLAPAGAYTVTDNYDTNYYGSLELTAGTSPLVQPTTVVEPGSPEYFTMLAANQAAVITLDDGATTNFNSTANKGIPIPYLSTENPVRIGAAVNFETAVVLDYRFGAWAFQPTEQLTTANAATVQPATFENTRTAAPENVGGDATLATFNVLNYFSTTGDELGTCSYYNDRVGDPVTVRGGCGARGAAEQEDLDRQQAKIVSAIGALDADVVGLEEIENSAAFGFDRDVALAELTAALNADAGAGTWSFVPSPALVPADEDVIRTAFIYKSAVIEPVGESVILDDQVAFVNAREPLAQVFRLAGGDTESEFLAIVNHFKSKGSGSGVGDVDAGDGQGSSNGSRTRQAVSLVAFAETLKTSSEVERVFLLGDFNAYLKEDPIDVLVNAGYVDLGATTGEETYAFGGAIGSLDHILGNAAAVADVTDVDIWNINSVESIALEYSRFNYNVTNFYEANPYRSSDHDPILVGLDIASEPVEPPAPVKGNPFGANGPDKPGKPAVPGKPLFPGKPAHPFK
ncbi:glutamate--cysteine ligase [Marisediminicola antarctica]|uniref:Glutamate--cysteine ligase n=2 Tax=Marisediminicola antarctica TaxID=674079 RepID=A0A7L5AFM4_9MICO|nr:glutamate--cysteine ligase [Marisediminicola antarctica]